MQENNNVDVDEIENDFDSLDDTRDQLDKLMANQLEQIETVFKKTVMQSILWIIAALVVYFIWPNSWYFWIPTVVAVIMTGLLMYVSFARKKLRSVVE